MAEVGAASHRRRYAVVGTGDRAQTYVEALLGPHADVGEVVAWCEPNPIRAAYHDDLVRAAGGTPPPRYEPDALEKMVEVERVDTVVVTSPDHTHADLAARAMEQGADVVLERPMATDLAGCRRVVDAAERTGRTVRLAVVDRYTAYAVALKELLGAGAVGDVTSLQVERLLDTVDGADRFRGWQRRKDLSGGLLVHDASRDFDLVGWWLADQASRVYASGALRFYGAANARARGLIRRPVRGTGRSGRPDPFSLDLRDDPRLTRLYLEAEAHDDHLRDRDVFSPGITIEDDLAVVVDYARGATLTYTLDAHAPWQGLRVAVNGTRGRVELEVVERAAAGDTVAGTVTDTVPDGAPPRRPGVRLLRQEHWGAPEVVPVDDGAVDAEGDMLRDLLRGAVHDRPGRPAPSTPPDPLGRAAGLLDGVRSVVVGIAGNRSLETGLPVRTADLRLAL